MEKLIVTRHPGLAAYLVAGGFADRDTRALENANAADVGGKHVIGMLPNHLAAHAALYTEIRLDIPRNMRGCTLTEGDAEMFITSIATYKITAVR